jgi:GNAT superfamily N-acetyltransferase
MISKTLAVAGIHPEGGSRRVVIYGMQREQVLERRTVVPGVTLRALAEEEIASYCTLQPADPDSMRTRIRRGDRCIAAWLDGRLVGARWLTTVSADIVDLGVSFPLLPGVSYAFDAFTAPQQRGRGIASMVTAALFECATAVGATRVINGVLPENPSGQGLARGRSVQLGTLRSNRLGPWLVVTCQMPHGYLGAPLPLRGCVKSAQGPHDPA